MLVNALSSTRFAPHPSTRVARTTVSPAHQQREGVTIHADDTKRLEPIIKVMLSRARAWACTQATDRLKERVQRIEAWSKSRIVSPEELTQFMTDLNNKLPVIDTDAEMAKFRNVWETFRGANNHFRLNDISHQPGTGGTDNELYRLVLDLDLKDLPDVARGRVLTMATQIMNAQEQATTSYKPVSLEGNKISLVTSFFPTSPFSTQQHLGNVSNVMTLLENAIKNQQ
jgi:hypothetical protein